VSLGYGDDLTRREARAAFDDQTLVEAIRRALAGPEGTHTQ